MPVAPAIIDPLPPETDIGSRAELFAVLARLDGWGPGAWKMCFGAWRLRGMHLVIEPREGDEDPLITMVVATVHAEAEAACDWALTRLRELLGRAAVRAVTAASAPAVRSTTAAFQDRGRLCLRMIARFPAAGMCCDGARFARFVRQLERFARDLRPDAALRQLARTLAIQRALRAALARHGLIAFLATGSRLARASDGGPADHCRPLRVPANLTVTIDLGALGRHRGLGIRAGVTALIGAPYHGKSTLIQALAAGRDDHRPGDGREGVVALVETVVVQAEDGRPIHRQDLTPFFARLPSGTVGDFSTQRASGATSMAASVLQGLAGGAQVLLIDEDSAAGNFLWLDPLMRRLLGRSAQGTTLVEALPALAGAGISSVLALGSATPALAAAHCVLLLEAFQPRLVTARARRLAPRLPSRAALAIPGRHLTGGDRLLGDRHFLTVDARECERPRVRLDHGDVMLDLRRCGWLLDEEQTRGAVFAAAWCLRLAEAGTTSAEVAALYRHFARDARALDPFATTFCSLPPWQLVLTVLERLPFAVFAGSSRATARRSQS